ncbi:MAG: putative metal-binding motif-containing protein, partial [Myxococcota bacterium]
DEVGDGRDQNCDQVDGVDRDGDGVASIASGGTDCNDQLPDVNPFATDLFGDGVDQNCDGADGIDGDGDGAASEVSGGNDCDDTDPDVGPEADDTVGDGLDQNCDGTDGVDADGDGQASLASGGPDCDDADTSVGAGFPDSVGDAVDNDCDGVDGVDGDADGVASVASGGADCDDADPTIAPGAPDTVGNGIDDDCDGVDGVDADLDGFASTASGGDDCVDTDPTVTPITDGDGDGALVCTDCDDADPLRFPGNPEVCNAVDDDCDTLVDFAGADDACAREELGRVRPGELDVLLVVDNSCSMLDDQDAIAVAASDLLTPLVTGAELRLGIVTTDMNNLLQAGRLQPGPGGARFIDETFDVVAATDWLSDAVLLGTSGSATERPRQAAYAALELLATTDNAGFARPGADVAVVFVTDENDQSPISIADWKSWFDAYIAGRAGASVHALVPVATAPSLEDLAITYGGTIVDLDQTSLSSDLDAIAQSIVPDPTFSLVLTDLPDPATLTVTAEEPGQPPLSLLGGVDYDYDGLANEIRLTGYAPPVETEVVVRYRAVP